MAQVSLTAAITSPAPTAPATNRAGGNTTKTSGNFLRIYRRQPNGEWRMTRDMFNSSGGQQK